MTTPGSPRSPRAPRPETRRIGDLPDDRIPVVIAARRTAVGRAGGALAGVEAATLVSTAIRAALADSRVPPDRVCDVLVGNAVAGGGNLARLAALEAGLPVSVPGVTVDRQCGSGLEAVVLACRLVAAGAGDVYLAGGGESVSTAPWRVRQPSRPGALPEFYGRARFAPEEVGDPDMGVAAENVAARYGISRRRQDEFALRSHRRAVAAQRAGRFTAEITPVRTARGTVDTDECPRPDTSLSALSALRPLFGRHTGTAGPRGATGADEPGTARAVTPGTANPGAPGTATASTPGTVTAGNSCPLNDGAAMLVVTSRAVARELGHPVVLAFEDAASAGVDPNVLGIGPIASTSRLLARRPRLDLAAPGHGHREGTVQRIEFNEAFASQVLASLDALGIAVERVNLDGGALALGHPFGASGAILVTRLFSQLVREPDAGVPVGSRALAMLGIAGGLGITALFTSMTTAT
ncbi:thiolase family protein [Streptomyces sp. NPDC059009]|uniref:thiolase family protein n=1 Tax=Streptomyces sp. NPDC059009 TaxID=3346694 RepID=UPI00368CDAA1